MPSVPTRPAQVRSVFDPALPPVGIFWAIGGTPLRLDPAGRRWMRLVAVC
jgi:hypothetical protein